MLMATHVPTHELADLGSYGGTSAFGMGHMAAHFLGLCAVRRHIGGKTMPLYAPLALLMEHRTAHFGLFSTNEPAIEPTKTQGIDERTQEADERTQDSANEPEVRVVAPGRPKAAQLARFRRFVSPTSGARRKALNPRKGVYPERPRTAVDGKARKRYYS